MKKNEWVYIKTGMYAGRIGKHIDFSKEFNAAKISMPYQLGDSFVGKSLISYMWVEEFIFIDMNNKFIRLVLDVI